MSHHLLQESEDRQHFLELLLESLLGSPFEVVGVQTPLEQMTSVLLVAQRDTGGETVQGSEDRCCYSHKEVLTPVRDDANVKVQNDSMYVKDLKGNVLKVDQEFGRYYVGLDEDMSVKGRLKDNLKFWRDIGTDEGTLEVIEHGYVIPFLELPPRCTFDNNKSAFEQKEFVSQEVGALLKKGLIKEVSELPYVVNPLSVSTNAKGKHRLILDLSFVNKFLRKDKVKFEKFSDAITYIKKDCFMVTFDFKSGYHHIDMASASTQFLGFLWEDHYYVFLVLPFGLSPAPFRFTKSVRPLVKYWRSKGWFVLVFLDDGFGIEFSYDKAVDLANDMFRDIVASGFVPNMPKSCWVPAQRREWLGLVFDSSEMIVDIPLDKLKSLLQFFIDFLSRSNEGQLVSFRSIARFVGKVISLSQALGPITQLKTRYIQHLLCREITSWDHGIKIDSSSVLDEINFWIGNLESLPRVSMVPFNTLVNKVVFSDASDTGSCAIQSGKTRSVAFRNWSYPESITSSTWRELETVNFGLQSLVHSIAGQRVARHTDNQNVVHIVSKGSSKPDLQKVAIEIYEFVIRNNILLHVEWVPREMNKDADSGSKNIDVDDWAISPDVFQLLNNKWGPYSIDRFASFENKKLDRFNSRWFQPGTENVNALSLSWEDENNWLVPPICLLSATIHHLVLSKAYGTLLVPKWPSAKFWPFLFPSSAPYNWIVKDIHSFPPGTKLFLPGKLNSVFAGGSINSVVLALKVDAR